jgi:outer membrane lipoprotein-sorting protein
MKHLIFAALVLCGAFTLHAQDATSIMIAARNRISMDTISTRSRIVVTAKNGSTSERIIDQYSKKDAKGNARTLIVFQSPPKDKDTRFLTIGNASGGSDQWIYLPGSEKERRIVTSKDGENFMGSDFSYDDISAADRDVKLDSHTLLREEVLNGVACYVIQSVPRDGDYRYSKTINWVEKQNSLIYKSELYDKRGTLVKLLEMANYQEIEGQLTPRQMKISTVAAGTSTTIYMDRIEYNKPIPEAAFTLQFLRTGGR